MDPNKNPYIIPIYNPIMVPIFTPLNTTREVSNTHIYIYICVYI